MRLNRILFSAVVLALFMAGVLCAQAAQTAPAAPAAGSGNMGFIDLDRAMMSTKEGKKALDEFQKTYEVKAKEIQDKQAALEKSMSEFQAQQMTLSDEKREERQSQLDEQNVSLTRLKEDYQKSLERKRNLLVNMIMGKMQPVISDYAKKRSFAAIFIIQQQMLAYVDTGVDITNEIIKLYDEAHPGTK
jgi:outer membrane protein